MIKIGRNYPCPCGSGKKYKRCCAGREAQLRQKPLPPGRFRYEHGSYGGPGGYMPSILCYKETAPESWVEHFCLVKPDAMFAEENSASEAAENHLAEARAVMDAESDIHEFALSLRHEGYKSVSDFRLARDFKGAYMSGDHLALKEHNDLSEPSDDQSERVARILSEWNPLGDDADSVTDSPPVKIEPLK